MLIGLGGGSASSMDQGKQSKNLDFKSVQRENPEIQRRCQQVIDSCTNLGPNNPIISIHDVGAGGLSNALPELVHDSNLGATFFVDKITCNGSMSPMEIWCNEAQERYVLAIEPDNLQVFKDIADRERCPFCIVGNATFDQQIVLVDLNGDKVIDLPMTVLFGKPPKMHRIDSIVEKTLQPVLVPDSDIASILDRVLKLPSVASKSFLITIGDRTVTGMVTRDQMVGPWQVPVADVAVTSLSFDENVGQSMSMGERPISALISPASSARMAVGEALLNLRAAKVDDISTVRLSANWMCAASFEGEGAGLYEAVEAIGMDLCPELGITIPVGKDSMSMQTSWDSGKKSVTSPLSLVITAYAPVSDVRYTLTPVLKGKSKNGLPTSLLFIDLAYGKCRLGGSALAQVYNQIGNQVPDFESPSKFKSFWTIINKLCSESRILSYHDRSDGGLITTILEMCFAGHTGCNIDLSWSLNDDISTLFNEELGVVIEVETQDIKSIELLFQDSKVDVHVLGSVTQRFQQSSDRITINRGQVIYSEKVSNLHETWSSTSHQIQRIRDNPTTSDQEFQLVSDYSNPGLDEFLTFEVIAPIISQSRPIVGILREQGINGHNEMAYAFNEAGFKCIDIHMTDLINGMKLDGVRGLALPGGFSYGDVLGSGVGWAKTILKNENVLREIKVFFGRGDTFVLGGIYILI